MSLTIINSKSPKEVSLRKMETYEKYNRVINWGRQNPVDFASRFMGVELLDLQKYVIGNTWTRDFALWLMCRNAGKALSLDTPISTPNGTTCMGDIHVGDLVYNHLGIPIKVIAESEIFLNQKCYELTFSDGEKIVANQHHLWYVQTRSSKKRTIGKKYDILNTEQLSKDYYNSRKDGKGVEYKYQVPISKPLQLDEIDLPIPPYTLGIWLGDGNSHGTQITENAEDTQEILSYINNDGYNTSINQCVNNSNINVFTIHKNQNGITFRNQLKTNGLLKNKHIPKIYLQSSIEQRLELLQGLMDTDGYIDSTGKGCEFAQKSKLIIDDFCNLLDSLCIKYTVSERTTKCNGKLFNSYRVYFYTSKELPCFKIKRKYDKLHDTQSIRQTHKSIISIQEINSVPTKCIEVEDDMGLFLCGKHNTVTHNSSNLAIYTMLRSLLFPFHATYFLGNTGEQAKDTFKKIEKLAKKEIESFSGSTDVFFEELKKPNNGDGFTHNPASFTCELFNGATVNTLNSDITNIKGKRADLVCFDEAGWFSDELFIQAENFVNQSENFKLGGDIDLNIEPKRFPKQLLYASSASDTSSEFYKKFKSFSQKMLIGDQRYFACNFTIEQILRAKYNGEVYPPLLSQDKVDKAMTDNRDKALRELYNKFSADSYENQVLSRRELRQVTQNRLPLLENDTGNKQFALAWDSGRLNDNSVITIAEIYLDANKGWCADIQNMVSLVDIETKKKTPKRMPEQVAEFKGLLLKYNANDKMNLDYENIKAVICDSGAGGNMIGGITDYLLEDWIDGYGIVHKGLIDRSHKSTETARIKYPNAVDIVKLVDPKGNRNAIFEALEQMVKLGVLTFPVEYEEGKDYIIRFNKDDNGQEIEEKVKLTFEQQLSLAQIELAKSEIVKLCRYSNKGVVSYAYPPDHRSDHDDRLFSVGLLAYYLATLRRNTVVKPETNNNTFDISALMRSPSIIKAIS